MIRYTLKCTRDHRFDSWFQSADAFDKLAGAGMVACAVCGCTDVEKTIMAPRVRPARSAATPGADTQAAAPRPQPQTLENGTAQAQRFLSAPASDAEKALLELRRKIEANSENVGTRFAEEARAIHEGEAPSRPIIGEARPDDARQLMEDGIPVAPLPWGNRRGN